MAPPAVVLIVDGHESTHRQLIFFLLLPFPALKSPALRDFVPSSLLYVAAFSLRTVHGSLALTDFLIYFDTYHKDSVGL